MRQRVKRKIRSLIGLVALLGSAVLVAGAPAPAAAVQPSAGAPAASTTESVKLSREKVRFKVLVFAADRGAVTEEGTRAIRKLGEANRFDTEVTRDPRDFTQRRLKRFGVVVFLNTSAAVLNADQQAAFEAYFRA